MRVMLWVSGIFLFVTVSLAAAGTIGAIGAFIDHRAAQSNLDGIPPFPGERGYSDAAPNVPLGKATWRCNEGAPYAWIRLDVLLGDPEVELVIAHELDHLHYMRGYTCEEWAVRSKDVMFRLDVEARAFCVMARKAVVRGLLPDLEAALDRYSEWLHFGYWYTPNVSAARAAIMVHCG